MKKNYLKPRTRVAEIGITDMLLVGSVDPDTTIGEGTNTDTEVREDRGFGWGGSNAADPENAW